MGDVTFEDTRGHPIKKLTDEMDVGALTFFESTYSFLFLSDRNTTVHVDGDLKSYLVFTVVLNFLFCLLSREFDPYKVKFRTLINREIQNVKEFVTHVPYIPTTTPHTPFSSKYS